MCDITELNELERKLERGRAYGKGDEAVIESMFDGLYDRWNGHTGINQGFERIMGIKGTMRVKYEGLVERVYFPL